MKRKTLWKKTLPGFLAAVMLIGFLPGLAMKAQAATGKGDNYTNASFFELDGKVAYCFNAELPFPDNVGVSTYDSGTLDEQTFKNWAGWQGNSMADNPWVKPFDYEETDNLYKKVQAAVYFGYPQDKGKVGEKIDQTYPTLTTAQKNDLFRWATQRLIWEYTKDKSTIEGNSDKGISQEATQQVAQWIKGEGLIPNGVRTAFKLHTTTQTYGTKRYQALLSTEATEPPAEPEPSRPTVETSAKGKGGNSLKPEAGQEITDTVTLENLKTGVSYVLTGTLMVKEWEEPLDPASYSTEKVTFTITEQEAAAGKAVRTVKFTGIDASDLGGLHLVVFESLTWTGEAHGAGNEVKHNLLGDEAQTVSVDEPETETVTVSKKWLGADGADMEWPEDIAEIYVGINYGDEYTQVTLSKDNPQAVSDPFTKVENPVITIEENVSALDNEGSIISLDGKYTSDSELVDDVWVVTNKKIAAAGQFEILKFWQDDDDQASRRPESLKVNIKGSDGSSYTKTLTKENEVDLGKQIKIIQASMDEAALEQFRTMFPDEAQFKEFVEQMKASIQEMAAQMEDIIKTYGSSKPWQLVFTLPVEDAAGNAITYSFTEEAVPGYEMVKNDIRNGNADEEKEAVVVLISNKLKPEDPAESEPESTEPQPAESESTPPQQSTEPKTPSDTSGDGAGKKGDSPVNPPMGDHGNPGAFAAMLALAGLFAAVTLRAAEKRKEQD